ncbi:hypothetical protein B9T10_00895 [Wohlfahrtiimonas chitiniclastica]|uniref:thioredoxin fold domain-containing protein n=1 Tax=Wohlfahrtiimonas chitiniclastica TaxID=400946 RepID=UPI000B997352|nr:thioredoxin fold domain-containing protein [Wohlfahrtiimonas chitiniclastica]OYQ89896.1 hypothetical protein B9T10_00895 [Wohlfahrtiimonas chitiniclastica]
MKRVVSIVGILWLMLTMAVAETIDRKALLENLDESMMIIYPAVNETHTVTIFTDVLCPYCRELHHNLADFTDHGITVRFVPFPLMAESKPILESIWCAPQDQQHFLLDAAMIYGKFKARPCDAPILSNAHIAAKAMQVFGTPSIFLDNGRKVSGFMSPKEIRAGLNGTLDFDSWQRVNPQ